VEARARSRVKLGACGIRWFECIGRVRTGPMREALAWTWVASPLPGMKVLKSSNQMG